MIKACYQLKSKLGIDIMSLNLLVEDETSPVIWRGPIIANTVKQFWTDTIWGDVDYMFIDMPPGTGDVPLTVFQSMPIDGIIVVSYPSRVSFNGSIKSCGNGKKNGYTYNWFSRKYELLKMSRL
jgi:Mrp family chromosome partitioning ATPase